MPRTYRFYVYVLSSLSGTLYIGVTNNLQRRMWQHKNGVTEGFTRKFAVDRLLYFEEFQYIRNAIAREKELKGWSRAKKIALIESKNPEWMDLIGELDRVL